MILHIHNFNGQSLITHQNLYSPELIHLLKQFFASAEQRNQNLKQLIEKLRTEPDSNKRHLLVEELTTQSEDAEIDIELVKKLLS